MADIKTKSILKSSILKTGTNFKIDLLFTVNIKKLYYRIKWLSQNELKYVILETNNYNQKLYNILCY